jgi:hypothetical protein
MPPQEDNKTCHTRHVGVLPEVETRIGFSPMKQSDDSDRMMIDLVPTMAHRSRRDGFVEFFNRRWLEHTGLFLENALGWEGSRRSSQ